MTKKNKKISIKSILVLVLIVSIFLANTGYKLIVKDNKTKYVSLETIDITIPLDDKEYGVSIKVTLVGKTKNLNKLDMNNIQLFTREILKKLDYTKISDKNGNEYIKNTLLMNLQDKFGTGIEQVILDGILKSTNKINSLNKQGPQKSKISEYLEGLSWSNKND